jgi:hypothetical protein
MDTTPQPGHNHFGNCCTCGAGSHYWFYSLEKTEKQTTMTFTILLDGVSVGALLAVGFLYIVLPLLALSLLIYFFIRWRRKNKQ